MNASERGSQKCYRFGPFRLNPANRTLSDGAKRVRLSSKAFDTLVALIERRGQVVDKDTLTLVWPDTAVEENNLAQSVAAIRKALGEDPSEYRYITTVPGRGYSFGADVSEGALDGRPNLQPLPFRVVGDAPASLRRGVLRPKWIVLATMAALVLAAAIVYVAVRPARTAVAGRVTRFPLVLPEGIGNFQLSPDGEKLRYTTASEKPESRIYSFASGQSQPIPYPGASAYWSDDSRWILFRLGRQLRKIELASGVASTVLETNIPDKWLSASWSWSPAWLPDGSVLLPVYGQGVFRIPAQGGEPLQLTKVTAPTYGIWASRLCPATASSSSMPDGLALSRWKSGWVPLMASLRYC